MSADDAHPFYLRIARIISALFDPVLVVPALLILVMSLAMVNGYNWQFLALLFVLDAVIPGLVVGVRFYYKRGDWSFKNPKDRLPLYALLSTTHLMGVVVAYYMGLHPLAEILLGIWVLVIVFGLVTLRYKISVHTGVNSTLSFFVVYFFGITYWWIWIIPVLVAWSRVYLKMHRLGQVLLGLVVPPVVLGLVYGMLGIL